MTVLYACSGGGHLKDLYELAGRTSFADEHRVWVTFDTGLSRSLLDGEDVVWARYAAPRDAVNIVRNYPMAVSLLRRHRFTAAVSTGASIAVNLLPLTAALGVPSHYIECSARTVAPSLTGRILQHVPRVRTYTQHPSWAGGRWTYAGSVFDSFAPGAPRQAPRLAHAVVTVGTTESYSFRRLFDRLVPLLDGVEVLWQTGSTDTSGLGISARPSVPYDEMTAAVSTADVVVCHAGVGSALSALEAGHCPVLVVRRRRFGEHVDDHQEEIAADLGARGLAIACSPERLTAEVLLEAAGRTVRRVADPPPLRLGGNGGIDGPAGD